MPIPIKDIIQRVAKGKGVEPADVLATLIGSLLFGSGYLNISPRGEVKIVASIVNELEQLMRMTGATEVPPSIYVAVESMAEWWVKLDRNNMEKSKETFPVEQLNRHEALLLILREVRSASERRHLEANLEMEEHFRKYGVPPSLGEQKPDDQDDDTE